MGRISQDVSFDSEDAHILNALLKERGLLSRICKSAIRNWWQENLPAEELKKKLEETKAQAEKMQARLAAKEKEEQERHIQAVHQEQIDTLQKTEEIHKKSAQKMSYYMQQRFKIEAADAQREAEEYITYMQQCKEQGLERMTFVQWLLKKGFLPKDKREGAAT